MWNAMLNATCYCTVQYERSLWPDHTSPLCPLHDWWHAAVDVVLAQAPELGRTTRAAKDGAAVSGCGVHFEPPSTLQKDDAPLAPVAPHTPAAQDPKTPAAPSTPHGHGKSAASTPSGLTCMPHATPTEINEAIEVDGVLVDVTASMSSGLKRMLQATPTEINEVIEVDGVFFSEASEVDPFFHQLGQTGPYVAKLPGPRKKAATKPEHPDHTASRRQTRKNKRGAEYQTNRVVRNALHVLIRFAWAICGPYDSMCIHFKVFTAASGYVPSYTWLCSISM